MTKVKEREKEVAGIAEGRGGARGPENVWGSAATAALCAIAGSIWPTWQPYLAIAFVASLATKLSDTTASEIGKAYGKTTYLITTLRQVPRGTEGAVRGQDSGLLATRRTGVSRRYSSGCSRIRRHGLVRLPRRAHTCVVGLARASLTALPPQPGGQDSRALSSRLSLPQHLRAISEPQSRAKFPSSRTKS